MTNETFCGNRHIYIGAHLLPPRPKSSFCHLKRGVRDFHMNYVLVPADGAAYSVVVVWRLCCVSALGRGLVGTGACGLQPSLSEREIVDGHFWCQS